MKRYFTFCRFLEITAIVILLYGCCGTKEMHTTVDTVVTDNTLTEVIHDTTVVTQYVHDTTVQLVHDTTFVGDIQHDSVDRFVEKNTYIDSNGVWHENLTEHVTHYIYRESNTYKAKVSEYQSKIAEMDKQYTAKESEYKSKISQLEKLLAEKQKVEYVEKELSWWQKTEIYGFWIFLAAIFIYIGWKTRNIWINTIKK